MGRRRSIAAGVVALALTSLSATPAASAHSYLVQAAPGFAPLASPSAVIGGARWPGRGVVRITYFNRSESKWAVEQAVRAWNASGVRVRFVPAPRHRAKLIITNSPGPRSDFSMSGQATMGYVRPGGMSLFFDDRGRLHRTKAANRMWLSKLQHPRRPNYSMAGVAAHELGHVLGLNHEDRRCATMNSILWMRCSAAARPCRLLEKDDIRGALRLYGGRARMRTPSFCPKPPSAIKVTSDPRKYEVSLEWRNPRGPFFDGVRVARAKGKCPTRPPQQGIGVSGNKPGSTGRLEDRSFTAGDGRLRTGRYCYALWSAAPNVGPTSRRKTFWVDFKPQRPAAPSGLRATVGADGSVTVAWNSAGHPELAGVEGGVARGQCPSSPSDGEVGFSETRAQSAVMSLYGAGRYCIATWTRDSVGTLFGPATVWVDYKGLPPSAAFSCYGDYGSTVQFYDESEEPDGEGIAARRWDFGDGTVLGGNNGQPSHAYAPGTYTVRLTVTDASGLSATTSRQLQVDEYGGSCSF